MDNGGFRIGMRALVTILTVLMAASTPARLLLAYVSREYAAAVGAPYIQALPPPTLAVIAISATLYSILMVVVVTKVWKLSKVIHTGEFFSKENVVTIRRAGFYLITISALGVLSIAVAVLSLALSGRPLDPGRLWGQVFNLPFGTLLCGILSLVIARAFERALMLDKEARFTV